MKRAFDILVASVALLFLAPLFLLVALCVKLDSPGSAFFLGQRVGRNGRPFRIFKFRSMVQEPSALAGAQITAAHDQRITRVGKILRRTKIDELPNLINVLLGDMSLVGPRPESPDFVAMYEEAEKAVLSVRPGITCIAQIRFPHEQALFPGDEVAPNDYLAHMRDKLELDLLYIETASFLGDLRILCVTAFAVLGWQSDLEDHFVDVRKRMTKTS